MLHEKDYRLIAHYLQEHIPQGSILPYRLHEMGITGMSSSSYQVLNLLLLSCNIYAPLTITIKFKEAATVLEQNMKQILCV